MWLTRRVGEERRRIQSVRQSRLADMSTLVEESLSVSGILLGKTMGRSPELVRRFSGESGELADLEVRARMAGRWRMASVQMSFAIMPALVYWFAGVEHRLRRQRDLDRHGRRLHDAADAAAVPDPVAAVGRPRSADLAGAVRAHLRVPRPAGRHRRAPRTRGRSATCAATCACRTSGFATRPTRRGRCSEIDAEIPAGTRTALVGETGSGKTTLAYLVARLYEPERGCVSIDGVDIRDMTLSSLAATVGLVSQETYLFHASIRENLRFACPEASDEEIEDAARAAQIHELIASLPDGYDTPVGERGYRFSGGEKQRMAIARTVLRNPPVLILDEATSALDNETERAVQQALDELSRGRTTIAIAHRLSTIRDADQILVLDAGRIVERGTHEELVELGGRYAALLERRRRGSPTARGDRRGARLAPRGRALAPIAARRGYAVASMFRRT